MRKTFYQQRATADPDGFNGEKRPADAIGVAVRIGRIATGEVEDERERLSTAAA